MYLSWLRGKNLWDVFTKGFFVVGEEDQLINESLQYLGCKVIR